MNKANYISLINKYYKVIVIIFFTVLLVIGITSFKDYGISYDEHIQRDSGIIASKYLLQGDQALVQWKDRYYGQFFELALIGVEKVFNLSDNLRLVYLSRHLLNFLLFYISVIFFYLLLKNIFKSWRIGLIGSLFLILSPRIFAESFYNSKDLPFMSMFIISIYTLFNYINDKSLKNTIFHSVAIALTVGIRIMGVLIPFITVIVFIIDILIDKKSKEIWKKNVKNFLILVFFTILFTVIFFPTLWSNPIYHFTEAFKEMSRYHWRGYNLYLGEYIAGSSVPWHYTSVWILVTTPLIYSVLFIAGCYFAIKSFIKNPPDFYRHSKTILISLSLFFIPLAAVIAFRSILYGGWRQTYFVYPAFLIIALYGMNEIYGIITKKYTLLKSRFLISIISILIILNLSHVLFFMIYNHPYQNVYFNSLAGRNMKEVKYNFPLDYWGLSYREGLEYILDNDAGNGLKIYVTNAVGMWNSEILETGDRQRIIYVDNPEDADYFVSAFLDNRNEFDIGDEYYSRKIGGTNIMVVYKLK